MCGRVEFKTQDEDADPDTSQEANKLVASAQAIFQISGTPIKLRFPAPKLKATEP